ncbi:hypothetical protein EDB89DRAFT_255730 [Lactarius sanguifluus]|nr:hypothetical protein EDB89DRAFT_255730 [Lactarius sanguifluus]
MHLAVLKPADRSDMALGHLRLGPSSNQDALLVYVARCRNLPQNAGTNTKGVARRRPRKSEDGTTPLCSSTFTLWTKPLLGAIQGASCGNNVHCPPPPKSPSSVTHFDERGTPPAPRTQIFRSQPLNNSDTSQRDAMGYSTMVMLSQAHVLKLGRSRTGLIALALSPFVRECTATDIPALYCFCARTSSPPSPPPPLLSQLSMGSPHAAPGRRARS